MSLVEHEAAAARVTLGAEPAEDDLRALGDRDRWLIYRRMVRARMHRVCETALRRTREGVGEKPFAGLVDDWLATAPPRTRFFRELPPALLTWLLEEERLSAEGMPPWTRDLARYEVAVWEVRAADDRDLPPVVDFGFEGVPSFTPAAAFLEVEHAVNERKEDGSFEPHEGALLVFRTADFRARCLRLNPLAGAMVRELRAAEPAGRTVTEAVKRAADSQGVGIDQKLIDGLSSLLEKLLTRGALRGCLSSPPGTNAATQGDES